MRGILELFSDCRLENCHGQSGLVVGLLDLTSWAVTRGLNSVCLPDNTASSARRHGMDNHRCENLRSY